MLVVCASLWLGSTTTSMGRDPATAIHTAIRAEAIRPNGDAAGRPLPLASRWTVHNFTGREVGAPGEQDQVRWPFHLDRLLDQIDAGHHILPFVNWNLGDGSGYSVRVSALEPAFRRMARVGLPFEIVAGNLEDEMFASPDVAARYWHRMAEENPALIRADAQGQAVATQRGAMAVQSATWEPSKTVIPDKGFVIFAGHGYVYPLVAPVVSDAAGAAVLMLAEPLRVRVNQGEVVRMVELKMDFWSACPEDVWEQAGRDLATSEARERLARMYPNPPYVAFLSNNEGHRKTSVAAAKESWHCQQRLLADPQLSDVDAYARGYVRNMGAYLHGIKRGLPWPERTTKAIGYNAFGVNFEVGRWGGWQSGVRPLAPADFFEWLAWDGSAPDFYCYDWNYATDEHVGSPHIGSMQAYAMLAPRAEAQVPEYQWQLAFWDGGIKKRNAYASWGELPKTSAVGAVAADITATGVATIPVERCPPDTTILHQGEFISIDDHSDYLSTTCVAVFDRVAMTGAAIEPAKIGIFTANGDVGAVEIPGEAQKSEDTYVVVGAGANPSSDREGCHFLWQRLAGNGAVTARVRAMENPDEGLQAPRTPWIPDAPGATYVDPAFKVLVKSLAGSDSLAQAGVMLRAGNDEADPFVFVSRLPHGRVWLRWRSRRDAAVESLDSAIDVPNNQTWLRIDRSDDDCTAAYSIDGRQWQKVKSVTVALGPSPVAGLASTAANSRHRRTRMYTVAADVHTDRAGRAVIPLGKDPQSGPILVNSHHKPIRRGARVFFHDYDERYEGLCHAALWLTRPRVIRQFGWGDYNGLVERHWMALLAAVDRVWNDPVLTRFWRHGRLVVNPDYERATGVKHPFWVLTDIDKQGRVGPWLGLWKKQDRFHQLTVPINPPFEKWPQESEVFFQSQPWRENSLIKVWAFAYELGEAPKREWLLFVQSPREDRDSVAVDVPGYGEVTVKVPRRGAFYHLEETATAANATMPPRNDSADR